MDKFNKQYAGLGIGGGIGFFIGFMQCCAFIAGPESAFNDFYNLNPRDFPFGTAIALMLVYAAIGAILGFFVSLIVNHVKNDSIEPSYGESAFMGAIFGGTVGLGVCNYICFLNDSYVGGIYIGDMVMGVLLGSIAVCAIIGAIIGPIITLFRNKEAERLVAEENRRRVDENQRQVDLREKERVQQQRDQTVQKIKAEISDIFKKNGKLLIHDACYIYDRKEYKNYHNLIINEMLAHEDKLYQTGLDLWFSKDYETFHYSIDLLSQISKNDIYKTAWERVKNPNLLLDVMEFCGLNTKSPLANSFDGYFNYLLSLTED